MLYMVTGHQNSCHTHAEYRQRKMGSPYVVEQHLFQFVLKYSLQITMLRTQWWLALVFNISSSFFVPLSKAIREQAVLVCLSDCCLLYFI